jgi:hypothetical protein
MTPVDAFVDGDLPVAAPPAPSKEATGTDAYANPTPLIGAAAVHLDAATTVSLVDLLAAAPHVHAPGSDFSRVQADTACALGMRRGVVSRPTLGSWRMIAAAASQPFENTGKCSRIKSSSSP